MPPTSQVILPLQSGPDVPATLPASGYEEEYLADGAHRDDLGVIPWADTGFDRATWAFGLVRVIDQLLADPKVGSTHDAIKMSVLADGIQVTPAILPKFGTNPGDSEFDEETRQDAEHAFEAGQFVARCIDRICSPFPMETAFWQLLDARFYGVKLAEKVFRLEEEGVDAGKLVLDRLKVKSQLGWGFVRDKFGNVLGIAAGQSGRTASRDRKVSALPRDKFVVFTNDPRNDDPRGRSIGTRVYDPFYGKFQTGVRYGKYLSKFAAPLLVGEVGPNEQAQAQKDPTTGKLLPTNDSPVGRMLAALVAAENCSAIAIANGASVEARFPTGNGEAFQSALAYYDKQIVSAMIHSARATEESQFGSRADSETAQDQQGVLVRFFKRTLAQTIRDDIARHLICLNYGDDWADRYTPVISLGLIEHQDFSRNCGAVAKLWQAGFLDESQRPGLCTFLGLPLPKPRAEAAPGEADPAARPGAKPATGKPAP